MCHEDVRAGTGVPVWWCAMNEAKWFIASRFVIETNFGGYHFDICTDCHALVPADHRTAHEEWHVTATLACGS